MNRFVLGREKHGRFKVLETERENIEELTFVVPARRRPGLHKSVVTLYPQVWLAVVQGDEDKLEVIARRVSPMQSHGGLAIAGDEMEERWAYAAGPPVEVKLPCGVPIVHEGPSIQFGYSVSVESPVIHPDVCPTSFK
jgi:hypothetical protein